MSDLSSAKADATKARLLQAAVDSIAKRGFHATTTRDIAAGASLSTAALYVHYSSKEAVLFAISLAGHEESLALVEDALLKEASATAKLRRLMTNFSVYHAREHTKAIVINRELSALSAVHLAEIVAIRKQIESKVEELLQLGLKSGEFRIPEIRMARIALLSLGLDIARWYQESGDLSPEQIGEHYAVLASRMVGESPRRRRDSVAGEP